MAAIVQIINFRVNRRKVAAVGSISSTILYSECGIFHINRRAVYIATVGSVNYKRAIPRNVNTGSSSFIKLKALTFFARSTIAVDDKSRAIGDIDRRASVHINGISAAS